jgi:hypothetical protein
MTPKTPRGVAHLASVALMAAAVLVATGDGFAQSYSGLLRWATEHHVTGWKADSFPLLVDLFILVGELGLFALALEGHRLTARLLSWADLALPGGIAAAGWLVSLAFNVGSVGHLLSDRLTAAVPPVASMLGLLVLLRTLHRLVGRAVPAQLEPVEVAEVVAAPVAEVPEIGAGFSHPDQPPAEVPDAGQGPVVTLEDAVMSARSAGLSVRAISEAFEITRYRVEKILGQTDSAASPEADTGPADLVDGPAELVAVAASPNGSGPTPLGGES